VPGIGDVIGPIEMVARELWAQYEAIKYNKSRIGVLLSEQNKVIQSIRGLEGVNSFVQSTPPVADLQPHISSLQQWQTQVRELSGRLLRKSLRGKLSRLFKARFYKDDIEGLHRGLIRLSTDLNRDLNIVSIEQAKLQRNMQLAEAKDLADLAKSVKEVIQTTTELRTVVGTEFEELKAMLTDAQIEVLIKLDMTTSSLSQITENTDAIAQFVTKIPELTELLVNMNDKFDALNDTTPRGLTTIWRSSVAEAVNSIAVRLLDKEDFSEEREEQLRRLQQEAGPGDTLILDSAVTKEPGSLAATLSPGAQNTMQAVFLSQVWQGMGHGQVQQPSGPTSSGDEQTAQSGGQRPSSKKS